MRPTPRRTQPASRALHRRGKIRKETRRERRKGRKKRKGNDKKKGRFLLLSLSTSIELCEGRFLVVFSFPLTPLPTSDRGHRSSPTTHPFSPLPSCPPTPTHHPLLTPTHPPSPLFSPSPPQKDSVATRAGLWTAVTPSALWPKLFYQHKRKSLSPIGGWL